MDHLTSKERLEVIKQSPRQAGVDDVEWLCDEIERLTAYANKLAAGLPEGMLPKDIEVLREANVRLAEENNRLQMLLDGAFY